MNNHLITMTSKNLCRFTLVWVLFLVTACSDQHYSTLFDQTIKSQRWLAGWQVNTIEVDNVRVRYLDNENTDATHTLLFVHGYSSNKDMWNRLAFYLPNDYRLIALDLLGHGGTDLALDNRYLLLNQAKLIKGFLSAKDLSKVHVVGSSMGGAASLLFALHYPDNVHSLSLMNSAGVHGMEESEFEIQLSQGNNALIYDDQAGFENMLDLIFYEAPWVPEGFKRVIVNRASERYQHNQYILSEILHSSKIWRESGRLYGLMPSLNKPVLVIWGDHDRVLHPTSVAVFKEHLPQAETHILEQTGHVPMIEKPSETANILKAFVTGI